MSESGTTVLGALERARRETARYGGDDWVFVRELLQNARDAGARRVEWRVERVDGVERLSCHDDGEGMTLEHGRRYLFTLYASSKRGAAGTAGRFGIGFWSVLRFAPSRLVVRSRSAGSAGWSAELSGGLERVRIATVEIPVGTQVILERPDSGVEIDRRLEEAIRSDAPFLRRRDGSGREVEILVAGRPVRSDLELPSPSVRFERPGLRGAVGLGATPEVRLYAHGLRIRTAAHVDELLAREAAGKRPAEVEGLMPRVVLDSERIQVLMTRGDAREDPELERVVAAARDELERFLRHELDRVAPRGTGRRLADWFRRRLTGARRRWPVLVAAVALAVAAGVAAWSPWRRVVPSGRTLPTAGGAAAAVPSARSGGYAGLGVYRGPAVAPLAASAAIDLEYRPPSLRPYFAVLRMGGAEVFGGAGIFPGGPLTVDRGPPCTDGCLSVRLVVAAAAGPLALPEPTGGRIDPGSVTLDGRRLPLWRSARGEPAVRLEGAASGVLSYRVDPEGGTVAEAPEAVAWPAPPPELEADVARIAALPESRRPQAAIETLGGRMRYDRSPETAAALRPGAGRADTLVERALAAGGGDCDVLAAVAGTMLAAAGLPVRLAAGWTGRDGRAPGALHAWLEVVVDGRWRAVDPSAGLPSVAVGGEVPVALPAAAVEAPPVGPTASRSGVVVAVVWGAALLLAVTAATAGLLSWSRAMRPVRHRADRSGVDVAELLRGVLQRPDLFAGLDDLEARALVPILGGGRISLRRARRLAHRGELAAGCRGGSLADLAVAAGATVLDLGDAAGRRVAERLGAHDLAAWEQWAARLRRDAITAAVESAIRRTGRREAVGLVDRLGRPGVVIRGVTARVLAGRDLVVLDGEAEATARALRRPHGLAALALAEEVADLLDLEGDDRGSLLSPLARQAVRNGGGVG